MANGPNDPHSTLSSVPARAADPCASPQYFDFTDLEPDEVSEHGSRTWWVRGQNFALAYTIARPGEALERAGQPDEYVLLFPQEPVAAKVSAGSDESAVEGAAMVVVPSGSSRVEVGAETPTSCDCSPPRHRICWPSAATTATTSSRTPTSHRSRPGPQPATANGSGSTRSRNTPTAKVASGACSAAAPSWSICSTLTTAPATLPSSRHIRTRTSSSVPWPSTANGCTTSAVRGRRT